MKFCGNCGTQQPDDAITCQNCGASLSNAQLPTQPPASQQWQAPSPYATQTSVPTGKVPSNPSDKGKAIASMVLGIVGTVLSAPLFVVTGIVPVIALAVSVVGIVLAIQARNAIPVNGVGRGFATAGLVCGIIGAACGALGLSCVLCACAPSCALCAEGSSAASKSYWDNLYCIVIHVSALFSQLLRF